MGVGIERPCRKHLVHGSLKDAQPAKFAFGERWRIVGDLWNGSDEYGGIVCRECAPGGELEFAYGMMAGVCWSYTHEPTCSRYNVDENPWMELYHALSFHYGPDKCSG